MTCASKKWRLTDMRQSRKVHGRRGSCKKHTGPISPNVLGEVSEQFQIADNLGRDLTFTHIRNQSSLQLIEQSYSPKIHEAITPDRAVLLF